MIIRNYKFEKLVEAGDYWIGREKGSIIENEKNNSSRMHKQMERFSSAQPGPRTGSDGITT